MVFVGLLFLHAPFMFVSVIMDVIIAKTRENIRLTYKDVGLGLICFQKDSSYITKQLNF